MWPACWVRVRVSFSVSLTLHVNQTCIRPACCTRPAAACPAGAPGAVGLYGTGAGAGLGGRRPPGAPPRPASGMHHACRGLHVCRGLAGMAGFGIAWLAGSGMGTSEATCSGAQLWGGMPSCLQSARVGKGTQCWPCQPYSSVHTSRTRDCPTAVLPM
jgi:hypothetical protein